eukprot:TRINITY_DN125_c0_g1_i7.p1 TRINITY_DN125_c0_g1~~TRINITY_DN125_c0_g1_i7.p1  ORF type:complete len:133 (-),score=26.02 TRINITY_DN125_c0_g1_i7:41-439(-)
MPRHNRGNHFDDDVDFDGEEDPFATKVLVKTQEGDAAYLAQRQQAQERLAEESRQEIAKIKQQRERAARRREAAAQTVGAFEREPCEWCASSSKKKRSKSAVGTWSARKKRPGTLAPELLVDHSLGVQCLFS